MKEKNKGLNNSKKEVAGKAYDDLVAPSAKPVGTILSLIPRTIRIWLQKWEKWVVNKEQTFELTVKAIKDKCANIPADKLTEPEPYVAVPAIQQLCYCYDSEELREMYANLLVSSMNADTKYNVHPAFVDIIKQLCPDEAKLLKYLSKHPKQPLVDVNLNMGGGGYITKIHNFTNIAENVCDNPTNISSYLDNLERLKLIEIPPFTSLTDTTLYKDIENHEVIKREISKEIMDGQSYQIVKRTFNLTSFAYNFIQVCIG